MVFEFKFLAGAAAVVIPLAIKKVYDWLQSPSVKSIQKKAKLRLANLGDDQCITVWGFTRPGETPPEGLFDFSPYVERVELYLRLKKQDYTKAATNGLSETPRAKVPFANVYGTMVDDSSRILEVLQDRLKDNTDAQLTEQQKLEGYLLRALLTGSLYWVLLHLNFGTESGRTAFRKGLAQEMPAPLLPLVSAYIFRAQNANLQGSGFGKLPHEEIIEIGRKDFQALSNLLGTRKFILGTKEPTVYDCDVFAFVGHFFYGPQISQVDWICSVRKEHDLLDRYIERMRDILDPDVKKTQ